MIGCLTETTICVVAKPLVLIMSLSNNILRTLLLDIITSDLTATHVMVSVRQPITY